MRRKNEIQELRRKIENGLRKLSRYDEPVAMVNVNAIVIIEFFFIGRKNE